MFRLFWEVEDIEFLKVNGYIIPENSSCISYCMKLETFFSLFRYTRLDLRPCSKWIIQTPVHSLGTGFSLACRRKTFVTRDQYHWERTQDAARCGFKAMSLLTLPKLDRVSYVWHRSKDKKHLELLRFSLKALMTPMK